MGSYVWLVGLLVGTLLLALAIFAGRNRRKLAAGDPNAAWKQAAAETGHPEVARPTVTDGSAPPPRG